MWVFRKIKRLPKKRLRRKIQKKFDGKPLTAINKVEIQKLIKENHAIYALSEKVAIKLADNWHGVINKPRNLRFIENAVPIILLASNEYSPYMAVMLQSLLVNTNPQRKYHFIIFELGISDKTKNYLINQVGNFSHCAIDFINPRYALEEIKDLYTANEYLYKINGYCIPIWPIELYTKYFIPYWFDNYPKVIYCYIDLYARADISEFYDIDIHGHSFGVIHAAIPNPYLV